MAEVPLCQVWRGLGEKGLPGEETGCAEVWSPKEQEVADGAGASESMQWSVQERGQASVDEDAGDGVVTRW